MNLIRRSLVALAAAATLAPAFVHAQDIKPRIIRFGYGLNEASNQGRAAKFFADEVSKRSGGKMKVRAIGAAALGPDTQMQQALIGGARGQQFAGVAYAHSGILAQADAAPAVRPSLPELADRQRSDRRLLLGGRNAVAFPHEIGRAHV